MLVPTYPNYDAYYHLVWGRELLDGQKPSFEAYQAPTEHPLYLALAAALAQLVGADADRALVLVAALVASSRSCGRSSASAARSSAPGRGLVAALLTASSFALLLYAARAYVDVPFLALVLWAGVLEAERPRRGASVMALLAVAGLLRPEAWILAGAYWLWMVWERDPQTGRRDLHPGLLALAAVGPVGWALTDLWVTGDPLYSLHATSDLAGELQRERGIANVPEAFVPLPRRRAAPAGLPRRARGPRAGDLAPRRAVGARPAGAAGRRDPRVRGHRRRRAVDPPALPDGPGHRADASTPATRSPAGWRCRPPTGSAARGPRRSASARCSAPASSSRASRWSSGS